MTYKDKGSYESSPPCRLWFEVIKAIIIMNSSASFKLAAVAARAEVQLHKPYLKAEK